jgi:(p)ppGpp synthase/HD superfamily hydrolase
MNRIELAQVLAHEAHDSIGQKRKYLGEPYWIHTDAVADTVASVGGTEDMIVAAHLHDVLEDVEPHKPEYGATWIDKHFGIKVLALVVELTDVYINSSFPNLNRAARHKYENKRLAGISAEAKTIKLADLINNTASIVSEDRDFAQVYLREKFELLPLLSDGNAELLNRASIQTMAACAALGIVIPTVSAS